MIEVEELLQLVRPSEFALSFLSVFSLVPSDRSFKHMFNYDLAIHGNPIPPISW